MNDERMDWMNEIKRMDNQRLVDALKSASQQLIFASDDLLSLGQTKGGPSFKKVNEQVEALKVEILNRMSEKENSDRLS